MGYSVSQDVNNTDDVADRVFLGSADFISVIEDLSEGQKATQKRIPMQVICNNEK